MPAALREVLALVWTLMNRSAFWLVANCVRFLSGRKTSVSRVSRTLYPFLTRRSRSVFDKLSTICFSCLAWFTAPGSLPPCPGSITIVLTLKPNCWASDGSGITCGVFGGSGAGFSALGGVTGLSATGGFCDGRFWLAWRRYRFGFNDGNFLRRWNGSDGLR